MNLEEMYTVLSAASGGSGAEYNVVSKWFTRCDIIDGKLINHEFFEKSYIRLCPNKEMLDLVHLIQLIGILSRHIRQEPTAFLIKFETVKQIIIDEIRASHET